MQNGHDDGVAGRKEWVGFDNAGLEDVCLKRRHVYAILQSIEEMYAQSGLACVIRDKNPSFRDGEHMGFKRHTRRRSSYRSYHSSDHSGHSRLGSSLRVWWSDLGASGTGWPLIGLKSLLVAPTDRQTFVRFHC